MERMIVDAAHLNISSNDLEISESAVYLKPVSGTSQFRKNLLIHLTIDGADHGLFIIKNKTAFNKFELLAVTTGETHYLIQYNKYNDLLEKIATIGGGN